MCALAKHSTNSKARLPVSFIDGKRYPIGELLDSSSSFACDNSPINEESFVKGDMATVAQNISCTCIGGWVWPLTSVHGCLGFLILSNDSRKKMLAVRNSDALFDVLRSCCVFLQLNVQLKFCVARLGGRAFL